MFKSLFFCSGLLCVASLSMAQNNVTNLNEVVVTANKVPQKQLQTGKVLTVISKEILERNVGKSLGELLNQQVGMQVVGSQLTLGANQEVSIRGLSNGYALLLMDGIPLNDPSTIGNYFDLNVISIDQIERIEILKGGQSTLYGSDAVGGVINIIRKKASAKPFSAQANLSGGSYGTWKGALNLSGTLSKNSSYAVAYTKLYSKGISQAANKKDDNLNEKDAFNQDAFRAQFQQKFGANLTTKVFVTNETYRADIDNGAFSDDKDFVANSRSTQIGVGAEYFVGGGKLVANYHYNDLKRSYINDSNYVAPDAYDKYSASNYGAKTNYAELYGSWSLGKNITWLVGAEYRAQKMNQTYLSISDWGPYEDAPLSDALANVNQVSGYTSFTLNNLGGFSAEAGGRYNHHSLYGNNFTYTLNPYYLLGKNLKVLANFYSSFKSPTLYQLYSPYGNTALNPEKSFTQEGGFQLFSNNQQSYFRAVYFNTTINDVIIFQSISTAPYGKYVNFNKQVSKGLELDAQAQLGKFNLSATYTHQIGELTTKVAGKDTTYKNLIRRPENAFTLSLGYQASSKLYVSSTLRGIGARKDTYYDNDQFKSINVDLDAYQLLDVYGEYRINSKIKAYADLRNILNTKFVEITGYQTRQFNASIGLSLLF